MKSFQPDALIPPDTPAPALSDPSDPLDLKPQLETLCLSLRV